VVVGALSGGLILGGSVRLVCGFTGTGDSLRLRAGLRRIRWVAQFGGAGLGRAGGWRCSWTRSKATVKGASGGACAASGLAPGMGGRVVRRRLLLVVAFVPDSPSHRRLTEAARSGGVKPHHCRWPAETPGVTPPARPAWLRPPTRRGIRDNTTCGVNGVHFARTRCGELGGIRRGNTSHRWGCPGSPVAVGGACTTSPAGRCPAGRDPTTAACDPA